MQWSAEKMSGDKLPEPARNKPTTFHGKEGAVRAE